MILRLYRLRIIQLYGPLVKELLLLKRVRAILALGKIAFDGILATMMEMGWIENRTGLQFTHGVSYELGHDLPILFASYHPSRQNTQTGRLTRAMFDGVFGKIRRSLV